MDYEKMTERLQEFRQEIASDARFLHNDLLQRLTNNSGYVNAERRYQIADYVHYRFMAVANKLDSICNGSPAQPIGRLPYGDKTNALLIMTDFLADPKVRENDFLSRCLEMFCMEMFSDIASSVPNDECAIAIKHSGDILSRVLRRLDPNAVSRNQFNAAGADKPTL